MGRKGKNSGDRTGGSKLGPGRLSPKGMNTKTMQAYIKDLGTPLSNFISSNAHHGRYTINLGGREWASVTSDSTTEAIFDQRTNTVTEVGIFASLLKSVAKDVAQEIFFHGLALAFPTLAATAAFAYFVYTIANLGFRLKELYDDYNSGYINESLLEDTISDAAQLSAGDRVEDKVRGFISNQTTGNIVGEKRRLGLSGNGVFMELSVYFLASLGTEVIGTLAGSGTVGLLNNFFKLMKYYPANYGA